MSSARPSLLLTRPLPQSQRFQAAFVDRFGPGWTVVTAPLTAPVHLSPMIDFDAVEALIFTSETAVASLVRLTERRDLAAWCVGSRTAAAARAAGFVTRQGGGDGASLAQAIIASGDRGTLLHVRGVHVAGGLAEALAGAGPRLREVVAYDQQPVPLTQEGLDLLRQEGQVLVPLFSPRAAELAALSVVEPRAALLVAAISQAVADRAAGLRPERMEVAGRPDAAGMLDALDRLIHAGGPVR